MSKADRVRDLRNHALQAAAHMQIIAQAGAVDGAGCMNVIIDALDVDGRTALLGTLLAELQLRLGRDGLREAIAVAVAEPAGKPS